MRGDMAELRLKYTRHDKDRHGNQRWYYLRPCGKKVRLNPKGIEIGSPEFLAIYNSELATRPSTKAAEYTPGTFAHLVECYLKSPVFEALKRNTRNARSRILLKMARQHGDRPAQMSVDAVRKGKDLRKSTPAAANERVKTIRALYKWGMENGLAEFNPAAGVSKVPYKAKEHRAWTAAELEQYCDRWPIGTQARLAFDLLYWTGQRIGDVARMGPHMIAGNTLKITQEKTDEPLILPITAPLAASLRSTHWKQKTFLSRTTAKSLGNAFSSWREAAGLGGDCVAHGLRKARATALANSGATPHQIMAVTGHRTLSEVERYTRAADQEKLARDAFRGANVPLADGETFLQNPTFQKKT